MQVTVHEGSRPAYLPELSYFLFSSKTPSSVSAQALVWTMVYVPITVLPPTALTPWTLRVYLIQNE